MVKYGRDNTKIVTRLDGSGSFSATATNFCNLLVSCTRQNTARSEYKHRDVRYPT